MLFVPHVWFCFVVLNPIAFLCFDLELKKKKRKKGFGLKMYLQEVTNIDKKGGRVRGD